MIPIEQVIEAFKFCLPYYEQAYKEKWSFGKLLKNSMTCGLCRFYKIHKNSYFLYLIVFDYKGHYKNLLDSENLLFQKPIHTNYVKPIKFRYNFLKEQIEALTKLQQEGYTHI